MLFPFICSIRNILFIHLNGVFSESVSNYRNTLTYLTYWVSLFKCSQFTCKNVGHTKKSF